MGVISEQITFYKPPFSHPPLSRFPPLPTPSPLPAPQFSCLPIEIEMQTRISDENLVNVKKMRRPTLSGKVRHL